MPFTGTAEEGKRQAAAMAACGHISTEELEAGIVVDLTDLLAKITSSYMADEVAREDLAKAAAILRGRLINE